MSSSRSDIVTKCVRPFLFSFSVLEVSSSPEEFQWCFKAVYRLYVCSFKDVARRFKGVYRKFEGCFQEV